MNQQSSNLWVFSCRNCGRELNATRSDAKYCDATCRKQASRKRKRRQRAINLYLKELPRQPFDGDTFLTVISESSGSLDVLLILAERESQETLSNLLRSFRLAMKLPNDHTLHHTVRDQIIRDFDLA